MLRLSDDDGRAGILDDIVQETERIGEFEDEKGTSSTQSSETSDDVVGTSTHEDTDKRVTTYAMMASEVVGEAVKLGIELSICVFGRRVDEGECLRCRFDLVGKQGVQIEVGIENRHGGCVWPLRGGLGNVACR